VIYQWQKTFAAASVLQGLLNSTHPEYLEEVLFYFIFFAESRRVSTKQAI
jgi:hypothetical protein